MTDKRPRSEAIRDKGRRARTYELSDEAADLIEQTHRRLESDGVIPRCSQVQALEILIRKGFKDSNKIP